VKYKDDHTGHDTGFLAMVHQRMPEEVVELAKNMLGNGVKYEVVLDSKMFNQ
jgi:hypothetical protein